ncbi:hypothetical protein ACA910_012160 [Epithemia clementina (nom. ined.)]
MIAAVTVVSRGDNWKEYRHDLVTGSSNAGGGSAAAVAVTLLAISATAVAVVATTATTVVGRRWWAQKQQQQQPQLQQEHTTNTKSTGASSSSSPKSTNNTNVSTSNLRSSGAVMNSKLNPMRLVKSKKISGKTEMIQPPHFLFQPTTTVKISEGGQPSKKNSPARSRSSTSSRTSMTIVIDQEMDPEFLTSMTFARCPCCM